MRFTFSKDFRQPAYASLLRGIGRQMETLRLISGCNVKRMMADLSISHPSLKKY